MLTSYTMRPFQTIVLAGLLFCLLNIVLSAQGYDTYSGFATPVMPVLPSVEKHPSLYFDTTQIADIKLRKSATAYSTLWSRITSNINNYKTKTASSLDENDRPKMAKYCAFAWILNGDAVAKAKAIEALMIAYDNVPRTETSTDFSGNYDEIYRATWIQNYCDAYDWIQSQLSPVQDSTIRAKITREADILCNNIVTGAKYAPRPHNHRSKPAYGYGTAALTFSSDSRAAGWLQSSLTQVNTVTRYQFSSDGIYREGSHYYMYTLVNAIPFLWNYKNVSGVNLFPYYQAAFEWPVMIRDQRGWMPNNEDGYLKPAPTHMVAKAYTSTSTRLHSSASLAGIFQWNWATTKFWTADYTGATTDVCWDIDEFLLFDSSIPSVAPDINPTLKLATGQVVFRNSWAATDTTMRYLLYMGVAAADNHDHPDELSYIINARNSCLAIDAGYGQDFPQYPTWYTQPLSHNLVMTNDLAPMDFATNQSPYDRHFMTTSLFSFSEKEAKTSVSDGRIRRGIAFINNDYWVIYDIPSSSAASTVYKLNIHGRGSLSRSGNQATWSVTSSGNYGATAKLHTYFQTTETPAITQLNGNTSLYRDSVQQTYLEVKQTHDTVCYLHLMSTSAANGIAPSVTDISSGPVKGFECPVDASTTDAFMVQKKSTPNSAGLIYTDGYFAWARRNGTKLVAGMMNDGTLFRWNGADLVQTSQPVALVFSMQLDSLAWLVVDTITTTTTISVRMGEIQSVKLNGTPISFTTEIDGSVSFSISVPGKIELVKKTTGIGESFTVHPLQFQLNQNYPNPFNPETNISYSISSSSFVTLKVYDSMGREVATLVKDQKQPGKYHTKFNGNNLSSGVYLCQLKAGSFTETKKLVMLK
jgi:hypothetical protein